MDRLLARLSADEKKALLGAVPKLQSSLSEMEEELL